MKRKELVNGASIRTPGDNRHNFSQVPAMTRPIPPPKEKELTPEQEKTVTNTDQEPSAGGS